MHTDSTTRSSTARRSGMYSGLGWNALAAAVVAGIVATAGCSAYTPAGAVGSKDEFTYYSLPHQPQTVTLVDTRSGEKLWTVEIPVGQQLTLQFVNEYNAEAKTQDVMRWKVFPLGQKYGRLENTMSVPTASSRRLDLTMRPAPEYATAPVGDVSLGGGAETRHTTTNTFTPDKK